jgi:hypothetical protein
MKANALDRLIAAGRIREIDRERVTFIVRTIVHPPERPDDPLPENVAKGRRAKPMPGTPDPIVGELVITESVLGHCRHGASKGLTVDRLC